MLSVNAPVEAPPSELLQEPEEPLGGHSIIY